jgi:hypothetical protein
VYIVEVIDIIVSIKDLVDIMGLVSIVLVAAGTTADSLVGMKLVVMNTEGHLDIVGVANMKPGIEEAGFDWISYSHRLARSFELGFD